MNLRGASPAAICARMAAMAEDSARCLTLFALPAARNAKSHSNPEMIAPYIAVIVFPTKDRYSH